MRNTETPFRDFYTWYFKDWFISGARARLTLAQRAIYLDLLGFCYTEGGITADKAVLSSRLGIPREHDADLDAVLQEFDVHPEDDGRLMHPRMLVEVGRLAAAREIKRKGGQARSAQLAASKPKPADKSSGNTKPYPNTDNGEREPF